MCDALHYLLDNIFIRFGSKLYRQIVGIPMGTTCIHNVICIFNLILFFFFNFAILIILTERVYLCQMLWFIDDGSFDSCCGLVTTALTVGDGCCRLLSDVDDCCRLLPEPGYTVLHSVQA